jgi:glycosyltransferase involved in cell wall biosynthesis
MGEPLIGHVGNFRPPKNHEFLVELMAELLPRMPEAQLVLVGDGPLRPDIEHLADRKGIRDHVLFLGVRSDVHRILGALDLFLFPSLFEGLPLALVEAQAAGLPCVTSDAIPEEADAGLGLIKIASLHDGTSKWLSLTIEQLQLPYVAWVKREEALWQTGHDIRRLADRLTGIYLDG